MSYATQLAAFDRTPQELAVVGVVECQNSYAALVQQLLQYTEQFDNGVWGGTGVTITPNDATAPDATTTADKAVFAAAGSFYRQTVTGTAASSKAFTGSIWMKTAAATADIRIRVIDDGLGESTDKDVTVTTTWQRFWVHHLFSNTVGLGDVRFRLQSVGAGFTVYLWGAQLYQNPSDVDREVYFPYTKRENEAVGTVSVNVSRCQAADAGDGSRCYYSRPTCQAPDDFNEGHSYEATAQLKGLREFRFCRTDGPLAVSGDNVAPLLDRVETAGQEIDAKQGVTRNERITFTLFDDNDIGQWNPRQSQEGMLVNSDPGQGTFWRRFVAIYRNYANPKGYVIRKVGFVEAGGTEDEYQQRGKYLMRDIKIRTNDSVMLECTDRLKLTRKEIPAKISDTNTLKSAIDASATSISLQDVGEVSAPAANAAGASPDYFVVLEIDYDGTPEKVNVTARDLVNNTLTVQRGRWGTGAAIHPAGVKVREVGEFGTERAAPAGIPLGKNPLDIIRELYRYAGIADEDIDNDQFDSERDTWLSSSVDTTRADESGVLFRRTLTKRKKVEDLVKEIREIVMLLVWVNEDQQVTCKLFAHPIPTDTVPVLSDSDNLIAGSIEIDDSDDTRLTRALLAWDLQSDKDGDLPEHYNFIQVHIALDEEESPFYGEQKPKLILTEWLRATDLLNPALFAARIVSRFQRGARIFNLSLETKDDTIKVGDTVEIQTNKLQLPNGATQPRFAIITMKKRRGPESIEYEAVEMPYAPVFFYAPNGTADYDAATDAEKRYGFLSDDNGLVGTAKDTGYSAW